MSTTDRVDLEPVIPPGIYRGETKGFLIDADGHREEVVGPCEFAFDTHGWPCHGGRRIQVGDSIDGAGQVFFAAVHVLRDGVVVEHRGQRERATQFFIPQADGTLRVLLFGEFAGGGKLEGESLLRRVRLPQRPCC